MRRPAQRRAPGLRAALAELREAAGLTQQQAGRQARRAAIATSAIGNGAAKPPRARSALPKLAKSCWTSAPMRCSGVAPPKPQEAGGRKVVQLVFESASRLPRRQQEKIAEFVEAFVAQHANGKPPELFF